MVVWDWGSPYHWSRYKVVAWFPGMDAAREAISTAAGAEPWSSWARRSRRRYRRPNKSKPGPGYPLGRRRRQRGRLVSARRSGPGVPCAASMSSCRCTA